MKLDLNATPNRETFIKAYKDRTAQLVYTHIISDLETPVSCYLKLCDSKPNSFLLESVEGGEVLGRHSIIGLDPDLVWKVEADGNGINRASLNRSALTSPDSFTIDPRPMMESFKALLEESTLTVPENLAPMAAGVFGYFGYDSVRETEHLPNRPAGGLDIPVATFIRPTLVAVFDNIRQELLLATPVRYDAKISPDEAYDAACTKLTAALEKFDQSVLERVPATKQPTVQITPKSNTTKTDFIKMVEQARDYISAGDIFQVVLSQRFSTPFTAPPFSLYRSLRRENPSPFLFFLNFHTHSVVGSSPEILVRVNDRKITIRPIAGTRPRGNSPKEDKTFEIDLLADQKERAEHLMLLDLGRNDAGRHAKIGSVTVTESFVIERYSHVMHIASNVTGELSDNAHPLDAVMAGFPAGTVSGAPKVRAMQIIDELENHGRDSYAGAIGYFSATGTVDTAITLRTGIIKDDTLFVQAGAGIVADSDPEAEFQECINKAKALFAAAAKVKQ